MPIVILNSVFAYEMEASMVLKRKIYNKFLEWQNDCQGKKVLMVKGARHIGKSTICEELASALGEEFY